MANLKIVDLNCSICNGFTLPTIHDELPQTESEKYDEDNGGDFFVVDLKRSGTINHNLLLDVAIDEGTIEF